MIVCITKYQLALAVIEGMVTLKARRRMDIGDMFQKDACLNFAR